MPKNILRLCAVSLLCGLIMVAGCALDPMERLSEDVDSEDPTVRSQAVLQLANLRDDRAVEALVELLESDDVVYDEAGVALVKQGRELITDKKPDPILTQIANVMNNAHTPQGNRARAAWVLGEIGDREAIPALRTGTAAKTAGGDVATAVVEQATQALKELGDSSEGVPFDLAPDLFDRGAVISLPEVPSVAPPEEEEEDEDEEQGAAETAENAVADQPADTSEDAKAEEEATGEGAKDEEATGEEPTGEEATGEEATGEEDAKAKEPAKAKSGEETKAKAAVPKTGG